MHKYDSVYEGMKPNRDGVVFGYHFVMMIRAILMTASVMFMKDILIFQIYSITVYTLLSIIFVGYTRPYLHNYDNNSALINESFVMITMYHMICFTHYVD